MKNVSSKNFMLAKKGLSNDDVRLAKGNRVSGDTTESWFQNRRFRQRNVLGGGLP